MVEISSHVYDTLKHQVQQLKLEQQSLCGQRAKQKEVWHKWLRIGCNLVADWLQPCCLWLFSETFAKAELHKQA